MKKTTPTQKKKPNTQTPKEFVIDWMKTFVEQSHPAFGDMPPCPFARQARIRDKVQFKTLTDMEPDSNIWTEISNTDFDKLDVLVVICPAKRFKPHAAHKICRQLNKTFWEQDIVVLDDHPAYKEKVAGVSMSNGKYLLYLVQRRSKLNKFSNTLKKTSDYYNNWSEKELDDVVNWRDPK